MCGKLLSGRKASCINGMLLLYSSFMMPMRLLYPVYRSAVCSKRVSYDSSSSPQKTMMAKLSSPIS